MPSYALLVNNLFINLNTSDVEYLVLRNYENLPEYAGNDIDILVSNNKLALKALRQLLSNSNWRIIKRLYGYCFRGVILENGGKHLQIDFFEGLNKKWVPYVLTEDLFRYKKTYKNFYVVSDEHYIISVVIKELLTYGFVRDKYFPMIDSFVHNNLDLSLVINSQAAYFSFSDLNKLSDFVETKKCRGLLGLSRRFLCFFRLKSFIGWICMRIYFQLTK